MILDLEPAGPSYVDPELEAQTAVHPLRREMPRPLSPLRMHLDSLLRGDVTLASSRAFRTAVAELLGAGVRTTELEDALQNWALSLLARPASLRRLLELEEPSLRAAVRKSLRRALTDLQPDWPVRKALAEHVRTLLAEPWPGPLPAGLPARLTASGGHRLQRHLVAQALVVWSSREPPFTSPAHREAAAVSWLMGQYFPADLPLDAGFSEAGPCTCEDEVRRRRDGLRLAHQVLEALGPQGAELVERRAHGESLQEISRALRLPVATIHERSQRAIKSLTVLLAEQPSLRTWGAGMQALRMLRELDRGRKTR